MLDVIEGPASVPSEIRVGEESDGEWYVDWGGERVEPATGNILEDFAALDLFRRATLPFAVGILVRMYGPLHLCEEHERDSLDPAHSRCTLLKPEPVRLWGHHARTVADILRGLSALRSQREPTWQEVLGTGEGGPWSEREAEDRRHRLLVTVERWRRSGLPGEKAEEFLETAGRYEEELRSIEEDRERSRLALGAVGPKGEGEWWEWVARRVSDGLRSHGPTLQVDATPEGGLRPSFLAFGVLPRVYLALAREACGTGRLASCSVCSQLYAPLRAPKRGQRNYCPGCRESGAAKRLHMRERRAQ